MISYTKYGHDLEALGTVTKVREFTDTLTIPYVWGGDCNRPTEQLIAETVQNGLGSTCFPPKGVYSTCSNVGLIDYFVSQVNEVDIVQELPYPFITLWNAQYQLTLETRW